MGLGRLPGESWVFGGGIVVFGKYGGLRKGGSRRRDREEGEDGESEKRTHCQCGVDVVGMGCKYLV